MDLGLHTTLEDANSKLDPEVVAIAARLNPTFAKEFGKVWDLFSVRPTPFSTDEIEVLSRQYTAPDVSITAGGSNTDWDNASDTTALPVSAGTISRLTIGDILLVEDEIVVVKSVDRSGNTIDVYERGAGETDGARHGTAALTAKIIGNAHEEGKVDPEAMAEGTDKFTNYLQLVEEVIDLSYADSEQARKVGKTADVLKREALDRVMRDLARTSIFGTARAPAAGHAAQTRGLIGWLTLSGGLSTAVNGAFTETVLKNLLQDVRLAGGTVNAIVMSPSKKTLFNTFTSADATRQDVNDNKAGRIVEFYLADGFGAIPVIVDLDWPADKVAVVNTALLYKGWKLNDALRFVTETNTSSREKKETLQGKFGLYVEGIGTSHAVATHLS
jgi:hypothetical protein